MRSVKKLSAHDYRLTLDVVDPEREPWDYGDAIVQVDLPGREEQRQPRDESATLVAPEVADSFVRRLEPSGQWRVR